VKSSKVSNDSPAIVVLLGIFDRSGPGQYSNGPNSQIICGCDETSKGRSAPNAQTSGLGMRVARPLVQPQDELCHKDAISHLKLCPLSGLTGLAR
jgi:hypothetical protein